MLTESDLNSLETDELAALTTENIPIDENCTGERWLASNKNQLAQLIAIIAMGQASWAIHIINELSPVTPAFNDTDLFKEAKIRLTLQEDKQEPRIGYPEAQRDGLIFEAISWLAARHNYGPSVLLKDPHVSSTSQGLDGLMIELTNDNSNVVQTTIFEDKCTQDPRTFFRDEVLPTFKSFHQKMRSSELVATASALLREVNGIDAKTAAQLSASVLDLEKRRYRAAFALPLNYDSQAKRSKLFKDYNSLENLLNNQRIGASLIIDSNLREWFHDLALMAINWVEELEEADNYV